MFYSLKNHSVMTEGSNVKPKLSAMSRFVRGCLGTYHLYRWRWRYSTINKLSSLTRPLGQWHRTKLGGGSLCLWGMIYLLASFSAEYHYSSELPQGSSSPPPSPPSLSLLWPHHSQDSVYDVASPQTSHGQPTSTYVNLWCGPRNPGRLFSCHQSL